MRTVDSGRWAAQVTPMTVIYEAYILGLFLAAAVGVHLLFETPARVRIRQLLDRRRTPPPRPDAPARPETTVV